MDVVREVVVALHLFGMAALVGGWLVSRGSAQVPAAVVWGARAQLITGILLVGLAEMNKDDDFTVNHAKIGVKLLLAITAAAGAEIAAAKQRKGQMPGGTVDLAGGAGVAAVLVATLW